MGEPIVEYVMSDEARQYYELKRHYIEQAFVENNHLLETTRTDTSPSGRYALEVKSHTNGPRGQSYTYTRGIVRRVADGEIIADIKDLRAYWKWVEHPDGNEYLLCYEDLEGYSVINLTQGITRVHFPDKGIKGFGFIWTEIYPSPDALTLAVEGCFWSCPWEVVFYDFSNPALLPLPELDRTPNGYLNKVLGWETPDIFVAELDIEIRKSDGVHYDALTEEEQEILDRDHSLFGEIREIFRWQRPEPGFSALAEPQQ